MPSKTVKPYTDPSGFSFNYPDNLSLTNNEATSSSTYADIQLTGSRLEGSLNLKITDSKFASLAEWLKSNSFSNPKEVKLGNLKALEVATNQKLVLGALDSGVFFYIEIPMTDKSFWMEVYNKVLADFSFSPGSVNTATSDVTFESEEIVE